MLPAPILEFVAAQHVLGLATLADGEPWAASCFYALHAAGGALLILTSDDTRHGAAMRAEPRVAGTIAGQPRSVASIRGLQFQALARCLDGAAADEAMALYVRRHPIARLHRAPIWRLELQALKYTDNRLGFGSKLQWRREPPSSAG